MLQWWSDPQYRTRLLFVVAALLLVVFIALLTRPAAAPQAGAAQLTATPSASSASTASASAAATAAPTLAPTAQPTAAPTAQPPVAAPPAAGNFRNGTFSVGVDIAPGTYRTRTASAGCSWARLNAQGQVLGGATTDGPEIVTIVPTDRVFRPSNCAEWSLNLTALGNSNVAPHTDGTYFVGTDMAAGVWKATSGGCQWARLSAFTGDPGAVIASGKTTAANESIQLFTNDRGIRTANCGLLLRAG